MVESVRPRVECPATFVRGWTSLMLCNVDSIRENETVQRENEEIITDLRPRFAWDSNEEL